MSAAAQWSPVDESVAQWTPVQGAPGPAPDTRSLLDHLANDPNSFPLDSYLHATEHGFANIGQGTAQAIQGTAALLNPKAQDEHEKEVAVVNPIALPVYRLFRGLGHTAEDAVKLAKAYHESGGPSLEEIGDVAGVGAGNLIPGIVASPEGIAAARGVASDAVSAGKAAMTQGKAALASDTATKFIKSGKVLGASAEKLPVVGPTISAVTNLAKLRDIWGNPLDATKENVPFAGELEPPTPAPSATPAAAKPSVTPAQVEKQINDALGGKPLAKNVPLKDQPAAAKLPQGFTPVKSSMMDGYKYDPATQHFEIITKDGARYGRMGVTPEQVEEFEKADSKGSNGWPKIKNAPGLIPTKNGAPRAVPMSARTASPEDVAPGEETTPVAPAPKTLASLNTPQLTAAGDDLLSQLQKSVENAKAKKLSDLAHPEVPYSPTQLAKRWGVDESSLVTGREQTRGMSPEDTEADVQRLTERYQNGEPVDAVTEYRDQNNRITHVDGRARVIAAKRAGVKNIPLRIVRVTAAGGGVQ